MQRSATGSEYSTPQQDSFPSYREIGLHYNLNSRQEHS